MKAQSILTAVLSILCFAFTATAGASVQQDLSVRSMQFQSVKQNVEDCFTVLPHSNAPNAYHEFSMIDWLQSFLPLTGKLEDFIFPSNPGVVTLGMDGFTKQTYKKYWRVIQDWYRTQGNGGVVSPGQLRLITSLGTANATTSNIPFYIFPQQGAAAIEGTNQLNTSDAFFALQHYFAVGQTATLPTVNTIQDEYFPNAFP